MYASQWDALAYERIYNHWSHYDTVRYCLRLKEHREQRIDEVFALDDPIIRLINALMEP